MVCEAVIGYADDLGIGFLFTRTHFLSEYSFDDQPAIQRTLEIPARQQLVHDVLCLLPIKPSCVGCNQLVGKLIQRLADELIAWVESK